MVAAFRRFARAFRQIDEFLQRPIDSRGPFGSARSFIRGEALQRVQDSARELAQDGYAADLIERLAWNDQAVTAAEVSTVQAFCDWFATQALRPDVQLGISNLAILFTDLRDSTQLYRTIGDAPAFERVLEHFDVLRRSVETHGGALIKTNGDAIMAAFLDPAQGVAAALDILQNMAELNRARADYPLRLKLGLHARPAIAVTLSERLDYFGTTVNIASRLKGQAQGDDLVVSTEVMEQAGVQRVLNDRSVVVEEFSARLKGFVDEEFRLRRIRLSDEQRGK